MPYVALVHIFTIVHFCGILLLRGNFEKTGCANLEASCLRKASTYPLILNFSGSAIIIFL